MRELGKILLVLSALFAAPPSLAAECDRITVEGLNSSIRANFTILATEGTFDAADRNKIEILKENFSDVSQLHRYALESNDQDSLSQACRMYRSILEQQETMRE